MATFALALATTDENRGSLSAESRVSRHCKSFSITRKIRYDLRGKCREGGITLIGEDSNQFRSPGRSVKRVKLANLIHPLTLRNIQEILHHSRSNGVGRKEQVIAAGSTLRDGACDVAGRRARAVEHAGGLWPFQSVGRTLAAAHFLSHFCEANAKNSAASAAHRHQIGKRDRPLPHCLPYFDIIARPNIAPFLLKRRMSHNCHPS